MQDAINDQVSGRDGEFGNGYSDRWHGILDFEHSISSASLTRRQGDTSPFNIDCCLHSQGHDDVPCRLDHTGLSNLRAVHVRLRSLGEYSNQSLTCFLRRDSCSMQADIAPALHQIIMLWFGKGASASTRQAAECELTREANATKTHTSSPEPFRKYLLHRKTPSEIPSTQTLLLAENIRVSADNSALQAQPHSL